MKIIQNKNYWGLNIEAIEKKKNAKYLGDFAIKDIWNNWTDSPVAVFYQKKPPLKTHSNYFGIRVKKENLFICDAQSAFSEPFMALKTPVGVLLSGFRHDYVVKDNYSIDGQRSGYIRTTIDDCELIQIKMIDGNWVEVDFDNESSLNYYLINKIEKNLKLMEEEYP